MKTMPTFEFTIEHRTYVVSVAGPGLSWKTVLEQAIRSYYVDLGAVQGRWVRVVQVLQYGFNRRALVRTSRGDELVIAVRPWPGHMQKEAAQSAQAS